MLEVAVAALALFAALALWGTLRRRSAERAQRRFDALVDTYLPVLRRKQRQLVRVDDYGLVDRSRWEREVGYFFDKVVFETLSEPGGAPRPRGALATSRSGWRKAVAASGPDVAATRGSRGSAPARSSSCSVPPSSSAAAGG